MKYLHTAYIAVPGFTWRNQFYLVNMELTTNRNYYIIEIVLVAGQSGNVFHSYDTLDTLLYTEKSATINWNYE